MLFHCQLSVARVHIFQVAIDVDQNQQVIYFEVLPRSIDDVVHAQKTQQSVLFLLWLSPELRKGFLEFVQDVPDELDVDMVHVFENAIESVLVVLTHDWLAQDLEVEVEGLLEQGDVAFEDCLGLHA